MSASTRLAFALAPTLILFAPALALAYQPPTPEQGALVRGFALPGVGRPEVLNAGVADEHLELGSYNEYEARSSGAESIVVDGEDTRLLQHFHVGFGDGWDAGIVAPYLIQGGGYLDGLIENWHRTFGLPNAGREDAPRNRYLYQYTVNGQTLLDVEHSSHGVGDIQLDLGRRLTQTLALRGMVKLPTGNSNDLAGNGAWGGALWLDGALPGTGNWLLLGSAGISDTATGKVLPQQQRHWLPFGAFTLGYQFTGRFTLQGQVYAHGAPYRDSALPPLAHIGVPVTVSGHYRLSEAHILSFGFQEKFNYGASPDFGIFLGLDLR